MPLNGSEAFHVECVVRQLATATSIARTLPDHLKDQDIITKGIEELKAALSQSSHSDKITVNDETQPTAAQSFHLRGTSTHGMPHFDTSSHHTNPSSKAPAAAANVGAQAVMLQQHLAETLEAARDETERPASLIVHVHGEESEQDDEEQRLDFPPAELEAANVDVRRNRHVMRGLVTKGRNSLRRLWR